MTDVAELERRIAALENHTIHYKELPLNDLKQFLFGDESQDPAGFILPKSIGNPLLSANSVDERILATDSVTADAIAESAVGAPELENGIVLELATTGTARKVAFGTATTPNTGTPTAAKAFAHGLGTTPTVLVATMESRDINVSAKAIGATEAEVEIRDINGVNITATHTAYWIAIG